MRAGETDKSISVINNQIFKLIEQFVSTMGYVGQIDIDLFELMANFTFQKLTLDLVEDILMHI